MGRPKKTAAELKPKPKRDKAVTWPLCDAGKTIARIAEIVDAAPALSPFEGGFLKEVARQAARFRDDFRLTPKQVEKLTDIYVRYTLDIKIAAKVKLHKEKPADPTGDYTGEHEK